MGSRKEEREERSRAVLSRLDELIADFKEGLIEHGNATAYDANARALCWEESGIKSVDHLLGANSSGSSGELQEREEAMDYLCTMFHAYVLQYANLTILEHLDEFVYIAVDRAYSETLRLMTETFGEAAMRAALFEGEKEMGELVDLEQFRRRSYNQRGGSA